MPEVMEQQDLLLTSFRALERTRAKKDPAWLYRLRQAAIERFAELGFPATRLEDWRFTNVAPLAKIPFELANGRDSFAKTGIIEAALPNENFASRLVFLNGHYVEEASRTDELPPEVRVGSLERLLRESGGEIEQHLARYADYRSHAFVALNTAFWQGGAFVYLPRGTVLEKPIHVVFLTAGNGTPVVSHPRNLIVAERDTQCTLVESYAGLSEGVCFSNAVTEIAAGENAVVDHYKIQTENERSFHIATLQVQQERSAGFTTTSVSFGGSLVRNEITAVLNAEGAECALNGLYLARGKQHVDYHTTIDHAKPHGASRQLYHGVLDGQATGVFNGRIVVRPEAQKTDAIQKNRNLLLSEEAVIDTKPQLEIFANDVRCTHGATIGQMDPEALFYLRSRGIGLEEARNLLIYAFAAEVLDRIRPASVRSRVEEGLQARLARAASR